MKREPCLSDLPDGQGVLTGPVSTAWKQDRVARSATGDPGACDLREVVNAIFCQDRTGCPWRCLPHDLPSWPAVFYCFGLWREDGLDQRIQELLRCQVREGAKRLEDSSLVILDTQSVRAAAGVLKTTTGLDADKKVPGRKRGLAVDVLGLVIGVVVLAASAHGNAAGTALLGQAAERCGNRLEKALAVFIGVNGSHCIGEFGSHVGPFVAGMYSTQAHDHQLDWEPPLSGDFLPAGVECP